MSEIAWFDVEEREKEYLEDQGVDLNRFEFFEEPLNSESMGKAQGFDKVCVFASSEVNGTVLDNLDAELLATRSTGYDHIDLEKAEENNITVCNVPSYGQNTVAEHALGLLLTLSKKIHQSIIKVKSEKFSHENLTGFDLKGKKIGIIGTGDIGLHMIKMCKGLEMEVIASDPNPKHDKAEELGFMYVDQKHLIEESDVISLHCPLLPPTEHLLDKKQFEKMQDTVIINTARGGLINTNALIEALNNGNVKSAGLDVLEHEKVLENEIHFLYDKNQSLDYQTLLEDHILIEREDVIVTPHNAFNTEEAFKRILDTTLENLNKHSNPV